MYSQFLLNDIQQTQNVKEISKKWLKMPVKNIFFLTKIFWKEKKLYSWKEIVILIAGKNSFSDIGNHLEEEGVTSTNNVCVGGWGKKVINMKSDTVKTRE